MQPKSFWVKSLSKNFINTFEKELKQIPSIKYTKHSINGIETIIIKCSNYYKDFYTPLSPSFYGNYIYLYTNISIIISRIIISYYENQLMSKSIQSQFFYFSDDEQKKIINICNLILDPNSPIEFSKEAYYNRREIILSSLLQNFRNKNYLFIDSFMNFNLELYKDEIDYIIDKSINIFLTDKNLDVLKFILQNFFY